MENLVSHCSGVSSTRLNNFGAFCKSGYSPVYRFCIFQTLLQLRKWSEVRPGVLEAVLFGQNSLQGANSVHLRKASHFKLLSSWVPCWISSLSCIFNVFCTADWSCLKSCLRNLRNVRCEKGPGSPTSNRAWKESVALLLAQLTARFIAWKDVRKIGLLGFEMQASAKPAKASGETSRDSRSEGVRSSPLHSLGGGKVHFAAAICFVIPAQHTCKTTRRRTPGGDTAHGPRRSSWDRVQTACRKAAWICSQGYLLPLPVCSADDLCFCCHFRG